MRICICGHREACHDDDPIEPDVTPGCTQCICEEYEDDGGESEYGDGRDEPPGEDWGSDYA